MEQALLMIGIFRFSHNMRNSTLLIAIATIVLFSPAALAKKKEQERLFWGKKPPIYLEEPHAIPRGGLVPPPGEHTYYPVRQDGQNYVLNVDINVNMTQALNRFYFDPKWRGEEWVPYDQVTLIERATRMMSTWKEYDEFSQFRIFNGFHKFFEKYSGYGPG